MYGFLDVWIKNFKSCSVHISDFDIDYNIHNVTTLQSN